MDGLEGQWALAALARNRSSRATLRTEPPADADQLQSYKRPSAWLNERPSHTLVFRMCQGPWQMCNLPAVLVSASWVLSLLHFTLIFGVIDVFKLSKLQSKDTYVRNRGSPCSSQRNSWLRHRQRLQMQTQVPNNYYYYFVRPVIEVEKCDDFLPIGTMKLVYRHSKCAIGHCVCMVLGKMPRAGTFGLARII